MLLCFMSRSGVFFVGLVRASNDRWMDDVSFVIHSSGRPGNEPRLGRGRERFEGIARVRLRLRLRLRLDLDLDLGTG